MSQDLKGKLALAGAIAFFAVAAIAYVTDPDKEVVGPIFAPPNNGRQS